jgi:segregation and condensation protein A
MTEAMAPFTAKVLGNPYTEFPQDLYIPPEALEVFLETFEGPLDLLLYLIRRQNLDILNIPIAEITTQYIGYVETMRLINLELAAEYLVMAATLAEIKSRLLLPKPANTEEESDPRAELIRRLQEYEQYKMAAEKVDTLPRLDRDIFAAQSDVPEVPLIKELPSVELRELLLAFQDILKRATLVTKHHIAKEALSTRERMSFILDKLQASADFQPFISFFTLEEGRAGIVVCFIAMLELLKSELIEIVQPDILDPIYIRLRSPDERLVSAY